MLSQFDYNSVVVEGDVNASWKTWERMFPNIVKICIPTTTLPMQTKEPFMAVQVYSSTDKDVREGNAFLRCERRKYLQQLQTGSKYFSKFFHA